MFLRKTERSYGFIRKLPQVLEMEQVSWKINWNVDDMYFVLETFLTSLVFFTLSIISENKETPNNITVSIFLAFKEKIHNWDL